MSYQNNFHFIRTKCILYLDNLILLIATDRNNLKLQTDSAALTGDIIFY